MEVDSDHAKTIGGVLLAGYSALITIVWGFIRRDQNKMREDIDKKGDAERVEKVSNDNDKLRVELDHNITCVRREIKELIIGKADKSEMEARRKDIKELFNNQVIIKAEMAAGFKEVSENLHEHHNKVMSAIYGISRDGPKS